MGMQFFNFFSGVLIARILGPAERGELANIISWYSFLVPVALLGVNDGVVYYVSQKKNSSSTIFSTALLASVPTIALGAVCALVLMKTVFVHARQDVVIAACIFAAYVPIYQLTQVYLAFYQGYQKLNIWNICRFIVSPAYVGFIVAAALSGHGNIVGVISANVASILLVLAVLVGFGFKFWRPGKPDLALFGNFYKFGSLTIFQRIMIVSRDNLDRMLLPLFVSMTDLGHYAVAAAVAYFIFLIGYTIDMVAFPRISAAVEVAQKIELSAMFIRAGIYLTLLGALAIAVCIYPLIHYAFGKEFAASIPMAYLLLIGGAFQSIKMSLASSFKAFNKARLLAIADAMIVVLMFILLFALPPFIGVYGACLAQIIPSAISVCFLIYVIHAELGISRRSLFVPHANDLSMIFKLLRVKTA